MNGIFDFSIIPESAVFPKLKEHSRTIKFSAFRLDQSLDTDSERTTISYN